MDIVQGTSRHAFLGTDTSTEKLIQIDPNGTIVRRGYLQWNRRSMNWLRSLAWILLF